MSQVYDSEASTAMDIKTGIMGGYCIVKMVVDPNPPVEKDVITEVCCRRSHSFDFTPQIINVDEVLSRTTNHYVLNHEWKPAEGHVTNQMIFGN